MGADAAPVSAPGADAKAEANPWYGYYGLGLGHHGGYYGGHYGYPYLYGKRSADAEAGPAPKAEADAKADPYLLYGYGYGLGHGYYGGYYGYPYYGYGHGY